MNHNQVEESKYPTPWQSSSDTGGARGSGATPVQQRRNLGGGDSWQESDRAEMADGRKLRGQ